MSVMRPNRSAHVAVLSFSLSEAQWDLYPSQAGDRCTLERLVDCPAGAWIQATYASLCDQDGGLIAQWDHSVGFWVLAEDYADKPHRVWSDVTIEFRAGRISDVLPPPRSERTESAPADA